MVSADSRHFADAGELTSVKVCWACFCYIITRVLASRANYRFERKELQGKMEVEEGIGGGRISIYQIAFAFIEGLDSVVQLLYGNRHSVPKVGDSALCTI